MTGFARHERTGPYGTLVCEIRSVNHRFLDATLRLPDSCRALEPVLRQALAAKLNRGKVDCTLQQRAAPTGVAGLDIDQEMLKRLLERLAELKQALAQPPAQIDLIELLRWPGVLRESDAAGDELQQSAQALFAQTLTELASARAREGERLSALIEQRLSALSQMIDATRVRLPEAQARIRQRFAERLQELRVQVDPERIEQEIALLLQRFDVAEELDRLSGHIVEARRALAGSEPAGRRLDFLMQEFNREANTLSSKSQDQETTRTAVDMKVLIEQMREQVQNIE
ncbi:MAG TPA: YicC/YloC family endoribonuclease [Steroidobacteraceae bacterium]|nr:YicC/YloC family endoribonuclease [Steroidobacteraceae bacterium]